MPIYKGKNFTERIYKGGGELVLPHKRIYKEKELVYGLYGIKYYNYDAEYRPWEYDFNEISTYSWGKNRYIVPAAKNTMFNDKSAAEMGDYKTHWDGWFDDKEFSVERPKWSDSRYIVSYLDKSDLSLYAKWRQRKYEYSGTLVYYVKGEGWDIPPNGWEMGGGQTVREPEDEYGIYNWDSEYEGECTWWVDARVNRLDGDHHIWGAYRWIHSGKDVDEDWDSHPAGWIACWYSDAHADEMARGVPESEQQHSNETHVAFVEDGDGTMSSGNWGKKRYNVTIHTSGSSMPFRGYVDAGVTGGVKKYEEEIPITECEDQDNPEFPDPEDLGYPEDAEWTEQNEKTSDRTIQYTDEGTATWGEWEEISDTWITTWDTGGE